MKAAAVTLVKQYGAVQSPDLNKQCTHLVICSGAARSVSPKERCAIITAAHPAQPFISGSQALS